MLRSLERLALETVCFLIVSKYSVLLETPVFAVLWNKFLPPNPCSIQLLLLGLFLHYPYLLRVKESSFVSVVGLGHLLEAIQTGSATSPIMEGSPGVLYGNMS